MTRPPARHPVCMWLAVREERGHATAYALLISLTSITCLSLLFIGLNYARLGTFLSVVWGDPNKPTEWGRPISVSLFEVDRCVLCMLQKIGTGRLLFNNGESRKLACFAAVGPC